MKSQIPSVGGSSCCPEPGHLPSFTRRRRGAAAVEFAVVAPMLFLIFFGIIEFGRAMMVLQVLNTAARNACRQAILTGATDAAVTQIVTEATTQSGIQGVQTKILVNGQVASLSTANAGDSISVQASVSYKQVSWLPTSWFLKKATLSSLAVMRRE